MKRYLTIAAFLFCLYSYSQKQTAYWYFGENAGLNFNSGNPIALTDSQMATNEGCATISDYNGNLLFYTNGVTIWNRNHEIMSNGNNLNGDFSSTNSAIIIPKPGNIDIYYIFTVDDLAGNKGLQYSEVNMLLDGGLGGVTSTKNISLEAPTTEKITAVKHQNDTDWWVLAHKWNSNEFISYKISNAGVGSQITSSVGTNVSGIISNAVGTMKFSPDGSKVAVAHSYNINHVQLLDFDDVNGIVSNPKTLTGFNGAPGAYGVEFSPNSELLYVGDSNGSIYQYNTELINLTDILNSRIEIANSIDNLGALQIAPNGKIYVAKENNSYLGVIASPNIIGSNSNYIDNGVYLNGKKSKIGLPPFIQSFFWKEIIIQKTCFGDITEFSIVNPEVSQIWDFGDPASGANNTSTDVNPTHIFSNPGTYAVQVISTNFLGDKSTTINNITISDVPIATTPDNYVNCDDNIKDGFINTFLLNTKDTEILGSLSATQYDVLYFEDSSFTSQIPKTIEYQNIVPYSQLIYAKIFNKNDDTCFDDVQFNLIVNELPSFDLQKEIIICSNNLPIEIGPKNPKDNYNYKWIYNDLTEYSNTQNIEFNDLNLIPSEGLELNLIATDTLTLCELSKSILIKKFEFIKLSIEDIDVNDISNNNSILINPKNTDFNLENYTFALDENTEGIGNFQSQTLFENVSPGVRTLYIKDIFGCGISEVKIPVIGFSKFFTPNNDGFNDYWNVLGVNSEQYKLSKIYIFDRFGKVISIVEPLSEGWNGTFNGEILPSSDYWFSVQLIDQNGEIREKRGHFSLIRK